KESRVGPARYRLSGRSLDRPGNRPAREMTVARSAPQGTGRVTGPGLQAGLRTTFLFPPRKSGKSATPGALLAFTPGRGVHGAQRKQCRPFILVVGACLGCP